MRASAVILTFLLPALSTGCLFLPGREALERLLDERGVPYARTRFSREPKNGDRPLSELRASLEYWRGPGARGVPRWRGVLKPEPEDLYGKLLRLIDEGSPEVTLVAYRYDALGWDDLTVVDYVDATGKLIGFDYVIYPEAPQSRGSGRWVGYDGLEWWEIPQMLLDFPVYLAVGLKEFAGEIVKSPLSVLDATVIGPIAEKRWVFSSVSLQRGPMAIVEDWRNGLTALTWRFRVRHQHTPLDLVRDVIGMAPVVGPLFDHRSPPQAADPPREAGIVAVTQGIHAGDSTEQFAEGYRQRIEELRPGTRVVTSPYRYGGVMDVTWSLLNISHGFGYDLAEDIVFTHGVDPGDAVDFVGFSGGAQRCVAATRALRSAGVRVNRLTGVAGPVAGNSCAAESTVLLGESLDDPVVLTARLLRALYVLFPTNVAVSSVAGAGGHHTPYFPNGATRAPEAGYGRRLGTLLRD